MKIVIFLLFMPYLHTKALLIAISLTMMSVTGIEAAYTSSAIQDQVFQLPRGPPLNFSMFSGYLSVGQYENNYNVTKMIHYIYTESQSDPTNHPLIFWTNGLLCSPFSFSKSLPRSSQVDLDALV
jgi:carboxypeptidase C (cathepsin A)